MLSFAKIVRKYHLLSNWQGNFPEANINQVMKNELDQDDRGHDGVRQVKKVIFSKSKPILSCFLHRLLILN